MNCPAFMHRTKRSASALRSRISERRAEARRGRNKVNRTEEGARSKAHWGASGKNSPCTACTAFFIFRLADANGDVDLARALHDHPHVDAGASERTEQTAGDARLSRHVPSDDGHHGKPVCNADAVRADGGGNVRQKRLAAGGDRRGRGDERDAAKPRCDVVKGISCVSSTERILRQ